jgi:hypothetical protein
LIDEPPPSRFTLNGLETALRKVIKIPYDKLKRIPTVATDSSQTEPEASSFSAINFETIKLLNAEIPSLSLKSYYTDYGSETLLKDNELRKKRIKAGLKPHKYLEMIAKDAGIEYIADEDSDFRIPKFEFDLIEPAQRPIYKRGEVTVQKSSAEADDSDNSVGSQNSGRLKRLVKKACKKSPNGSKTHPQLLPIQMIQGADHEAKKIKAKSRFQKTISEVRKTTKERLEQKKLSARMSKAANQIAKLPLIENHSAKLSKLSSPKSKLERADLGKPSCGSKEELSGFD